MPLIIKTTSWEDYLDPSGQAFVKALIMGDHGSGKTRSASFWPDPIFADCERGRMSLADRAMPFADIRSTADMDALLEMLRMEGMKPVDKRKYKTLVIDTFDSYQRTVIQERLKAEKKESLSGWADWGYLDGKMTQLIEKLLNLPMNIIVNLHVKEVKDGGEEDGDNSILVRKARLKGDIKDAIFQDFDLIGQMETSYTAVKGERVLQRNIRWWAEPKFPVLRDRSGRLPRFTAIDFTEQDYWRIFNALTSDIDNLPDSQQLEVLDTGDTDAEVQPAGPDEKGGPVDPGKLPAKKAAAKKTAAKKAASKPEAAQAAQPEEAKEEAKPAAAVVESTPTPPSADNGKGTAETPVTIPASCPAALEHKTKEACDHVHSSDGTCLKNTFGPKCGEAPAPAAESPAEPSTPVEELAAATDDGTEAQELLEKELDAEVTSAPGQRNPSECGFQPESHRQFDDAPDGCGKDLTDANRAKVNLTLLRAHAMLCDSCFDAWKAAKAS